MTESPYVGLAPFSDKEEQAAYFFGRERERDVITANLRSARLTLLYGPSGVGKSSLLNAGVVYHLRRRATENLKGRGKPGFVVVSFNSWRDNPLKGLRERVRTTLEELPGGFTAPASASLADMLHEWSRHKLGDLLLILDQFEEYFIAHPDADGGEDAVAAELAGIVYNPEIRCNILLCIREDWLCRLDRFKSHLPDIYKNFLRVEHLDRAGATAAIEKPLAEYDRRGGERIEVEPELEKAVLQTSHAEPTSEKEAAARERYEATYLQLVMTRLWEEETSAGSRQLRLSTLQSLSKEQDIVQEHVNRILEGLTNAEQHVAASIFQYLVTSSGTKKAQNLDDLAEWEGLDPSFLATLVSKLVSAKLLVRIAPPPGETVDLYEIPHDVLALKVRNWRVRFDQKLKIEEARRKAKEREHARSIRRIRILLWIAASLALVASFFAVLAYRQSKTADRLRMQSVARSLATDAARHMEEFREDDRAADRAALMARQAWLMNARTEGDSAAVIDASLRRILMAPFFSRQLRVGGRIVSLALSGDAGVLAVASEDANVKLYRVQAQPGPPMLLLTDERIRAVAFSPDGKVLAAASDASVFLWNAADFASDSEPRAKLAAGGGTITALAISADSRRVAAAAEILPSREGEQATGRLSVWSVEEPAAARRTVEGACRRFASIALSSNGEALLSGCFDGSIERFDLTRGTKQLLTPGAAAVASVAFSADATGWAAGRYADKSIGVVTAGPRSRSLTLLGHESAPITLAFSADGRWLASGDEDSTVRLWNTGDPEQKAVLRGHDDYILSLAFSPGGRLLASGSEDGVVRLWDLSRSQEGRRTWTNRDALPLAVAFDADGQSIAFGSDGYRVRVAKVGGSGTFDFPQRHTDDILTLAYSKDGALLASGGEDGSVRVWDPKLKREAFVFQEKHQEDVTSVAFDPSGTKLASGSYDKRVLLWNLSDPAAAPKRIGEHKEAVTAVAFTPDGRNLVSAARDKAVLVWDLATGKVVRQLDRHAAAVVALAVHPDGNRILSADDARNVWLWDLRRGDEPAAKWHDVPATALAFSHDGAQFAAACRDGTVRIWEVRSPTAAPVYLRGHQREATAVAFSPDGRNLVSASGDLNVTLWPTADSLAEVVCEKAWRNLSRSEWKQFIGSDVPYERTCPDLSEIETPRAR